MKILIILLSVVLFTASPLFAVDEAAMRAACPIKYIETWKDQESRAKCEAAFMERERDIQNNPGKYIDEANRRSQNALIKAQEAERRARDAEWAAEEAKRKASRR